MKRIHFFVVMFNMCIASREINLERSKNQHNVCIKDIKCPLLQFLDDASWLVVVISVETLKVLSAANV